jgi:hypothetical protein
MTLITKQLKKVQRLLNNLAGFYTKHFNFIIYAWGIQYTKIKRSNLENKSGTLGLLITTQFEVLTSLDSELHLVLTG